MRPSHLLASISAAALMAGGAPLWAADNTTDFPTLHVDGNQRVITSSVPLVYNTAMDDSNLTFADAAQRLVIDPAHGVKFSAGVDFTQEMGEIEFHGDVTFDLVDPAAKTLKLSELAFVGSDEGEAPTVLTVNNASLALGTETKLSIDKNLKVDFNARGGIDEIPQLYLGENDDTTLSFDDATVLTATELLTGSVGHQTVIDGPLQVGAAEIPITQGLAVTNSITVNGDTIVNGNMSGGGGTNFIFGEEASLRLAEGAVGSVLAPETKFAVSKDLLSDVILKEIAVTAFKPFEITDNASDGLMRTYQNLIENMALDDSNVTFLSGTGEIAYDPDSGYVVFADYEGRAALSGVPGYGVPYVQALDAAHPTLAIAIKGVAKVADVNQDLNKLMGNVPNAAVSAALSGNLNQVMGHLNSTLSPTMPGFAGPMGAANGLWITPAYSLTEITGNPEEGYGDVEIKNPNVTLGYDRWINDRLRLGVFAALSQPESRGDNETIKTDNLQAGLYGQAQLNYGINVNVGGAYSQQSHDAERDVLSSFLAGYEQAVTASFDGDTLSGAVEVSRLYPVAQNAFVRPTVAYNYVSTSVDGYEEKSDIANQGNSLAQKAEATDFTMHLVKVGAEGGWSNDLTTVTGRLFWVGNLGDTQPETRASLISDGSVPFTLAGAEYDKNMVNVGLGVKYTPPQSKGLTLGLNYDALLGSNATSHNMSLMMRYEF